MTSNTFVGRTAELQALRRSFERLVADRGEMVTIAGEPGIGKTAFVRHLANEPAGRGVTTLYGSPSLVERHPETMRSGWETGVPLLAGTDGGIVAHGLVRDEIGLLKGAGIPAEKALGAGSWRARDFLGFPAIEQGAPADLVAYERDPLEDLDVLSAPAVIVLDGNVLRSRDAHLHSGEPLTPTGVKQAVSGSGTRPERVSPLRPRLVPHRRYVLPPSTANVVPVTNEASGPHRNATARPISVSASPHRPIGTWESTCSSTPS